MRFLLSSQEDVARLAVVGIAGDVVRPAVGVAGDVARLGKTATDGSRDHTGKGLNPTQQRAGNGAYLQSDPTPPLPTEACARRSGASSSCAAWRMGVVR